MTQRMARGLAAAASNAPFAAALAFLRCLSR
jgi:hypothetical protein